MHAPAALWHALCSTQHESGCIPACDGLTPMEHVPPARVGVVPVARAVDKVARLPVDGAPAVLLQQPTWPGAIADALMGAGAALQDRCQVELCCQRQDAAQADFGCSSGGWTAAGQAFMSSFVNAQQQGDRAQLTSIGSDFAAICMASSPSGGPPWQQCSRGALGSPSCPAAHPRSRRAGTAGRPCSGVPSCLQPGDTALQGMTASGVSPAIRRTVPPPASHSGAVPELSCACCAQSELLMSPSSPGAQAVPLLPGLEHRGTVSEANSPR